jgi:hypothetical protein
MLGKRSKKASNESFSSQFDLAKTANNQQTDNHSIAASISSSSRAFNFLIERAKGVVGLGANQRSRTISEGRLSPSSIFTSASSPSNVNNPTRHFFGRASTDDLNSGKGLPSSASMQELPKLPAFFRRQPTSSAPSRPGWLSTDAARTGRDSPSSQLATSTSIASPIEEGEETGVYVGGSRRIGAPAVDSSASALADSVS